LSYEREVRELLTTTDDALIVRGLRVDQGLSWRAVGEDMRGRWETLVGKGDTQSLGATICHVAAELLDEDPDSEPWN